MVVGVQEEEKREVAVVGRGEEECEFELAELSVPQLVFLLMPFRHEVLHTHPRLERLGERCRQLRMVLTVTSHFK